MTTRYKAKYKELRIPMKKAYTKEIEGSVVVVPGEAIQFTDTIYETDNEAIIKFLETDPVCVQMQSNQVFAKIEGDIIDAATKQETLEEREARLEKEIADLKKQKKEVSAKEKGKTKKVGSKKEEPAY